MSGLGLAVEFYTGQSQRTPDEVGGPALGYFVLPKERQMFLQESSP